jgi:uncharacterized membrane protein
MQAERITFAEKIEVYFYKFVTFIPVIITFFVFAFLFSYYSYVSNSEYNDYLYLFIAKHFNRNKLSKFNNKIYKIVILIYLLKLQIKLIKLIKL